jgi:MFS family permease
MTCLCACVFIAALDITIVTTALPTIANQFASNAGYTWIGTSFTLAHTASTPSWGKISDIWGRKPMLMGANAIFFAGSLMCALVGDMDSFIAGRVLQGLGAGGMQTIVNICISDLFSQRDRGFYYGLTSVVWALASGIGPVMGGVFTSRLRYVSRSEIVATGTDDVLSAAGGGAFGSIVSGLVLLIMEHTTDNK